MPARHYVIVEFSFNTRWETVSVGHGPIEHSIAIQKDRTSRYFVLSHFVSAIFRAGCETHRCQTTAWNASECGVTFAELTLGITTATSATRAV